MFCIVKSGAISKKPIYAVRLTFDMELWQNSIDSSYRVLGLQSAEYEKCESGVEEFSEAPFREIGGMVSKLCEQVSVEHSAVPRIFE